MSVIRFVWKLQALQAAAERGTRLALLRTGYRIEREAKSSMVFGGGRRRIPSPPGTPPHRQKSALSGSVGTAWSDADKSVVVGPTERYGAIHEFGGKRHPKRPFMAPALARVLHEFPEEFKGAIHA